MFGLNDMRFGGQGLPTYALNTDGIDPSGSNIVIRNLTITSYDDAVAVKPAHQGG
jgi:polygalacturonase